MILTIAALLISGGSRKLDIQFRKSCYGQVAKTAYLTPSFFAPLASNIGSCARDATSLGRRTTMLSFINFVRSSSYTLALRSVRLMTTKPFGPPKGIEHPPLEYPLISSVASRMVYFTSPSNIFTTSCGVRGGRFSTSIVAECVCRKGSASQFIFLPVSARYRHVTSN